MTASYLLSKTAEEEVHELLTFVAERDGIERALHEHDKLARAFESLAAMPGIGSRRIDLTGDRVRWYPVFGWIVIYDPVVSPVIILRVIHGARELDRILRPDP